MYLNFSRIIKNLFKLVLYIIFVLLLVGFVISFIFPIGYKDYINKYSLKNDIDPFLVAALINVESKYNKEALSPKNARGLMQIGEQTGIWGSEVLGIQEFDEDALFNPEINISIGTWYLKQLKGEFNNSLGLVLAAYNAGSGNVNKWLQDKRYSNDGMELDQIPFKETEEYLQKVEINYNIYKLIYKDYLEKPDSMNIQYIDVIIKTRTFFSDLIKSL